MTKVFIKKIVVLNILLLAVFVLTGCKDKITQKYDDVTTNIQNEITETTYTDPFAYLENTYKEGESYISTVNDIALKDSDGKKKNYTFIYNNEKYLATYTKENWHINNSYKIRNKKDITIICQALIDVHPIHGADKKSYRTADDMMYEWVAHNIAYDYLPDGNSWKNHAKDVDLNPEDQGKSLKELYESRINNKK